MLGAGVLNGLANGIEVLGADGGHGASQVAKRLADGSEHDITAMLDERHVVALGKAERLADGFGDGELASAADACARHGGLENVSQPVKSKA